MGLSPRDLSPGPAQAVRCTRAACTALGRATVCLPRSQATPIDCQTNAALARSRFATIRSSDVAFLPEGQAVPVPASGLPALAAPLAAIVAELAGSGAWLAADFVLRFFPVFDFQRQSVGALFCTPMYARAGGEALYGHRAFHDLSVEAWSAIDCAILEHALAFARRMAAAQIIVGVGASVSFATLSDPVGRMMYRDALRAAHAREQAYLVLKIEDIPDSVGGKRIAEIVSSVRGLVPRVWVHLPGSHMPLGGHEQLHAAGLVLSMPARLPMHGMATEARWLAKVATMQSALACMDHVDSATELEFVRAAGIEFVAGRAVGRTALSAFATIEEVRATLDGPAGGTAT